MGRPTSLATTNGALVASTLTCESPAGSFSRGRTWTMGLSTSMCMKKRRTFRATCPFQAGPCGLRSCPVSPRESAIGCLSLVSMRKRKHRSVASSYSVDLEDG
eukprot:scaffold869_cov303-Pinguiococcus_pyrenoidosus.AAC.18